MTGIRRRGSGRKDEKDAPAAKAGPGFVVAEIRPGKAGRSPVSLTWKSVFIEAQRESWGRAILKAINKTRRFGRDGFLYLVRADRAKMLAERETVYQTDRDTMWCDSPVKNGDGSITACGKCAGCGSWKRTMDVMSGLDDVELPLGEAQEEAREAAECMLGACKVNAPWVDEVDSDELMRKLGAQPLRTADREAFNCAI